MRSQSPFILLLVALAVLFGLLALFGRTESIIGSRTLLGTDEVGLVGEGESGFRHIALGDFNLDFRQDEGPTIEQGEQVAIARGALTAEEHEMRFDLSKSQLEKLTGSRLSFRVADTNNYGTLLVRLNGRLVWSGTPLPGSDVEIDLDKFLQMFSEGTNIIQFSTTSSGWRLWSPSLYVIDRIVFQESVKETMRQQFSFSLSPEEVDSWMLGRLVFTVVSASDSVTDMIVKVNNATVWRGVPQRGALPVVVDFSKTVSGISTANELIFEVSNPGSFAIKNAEIIVFTAGKSKGAPSYQFTVTDSEAAALRSRSLRGVVEFEILDVSKDGTLTVSLVGERSKVLKSERMGKGRVELSFTDEHAGAGENFVSFSSDGAYFIGPLSVRVVRS